MASSMSNIRRCADNILNDFKNVNEQITHLKDLRAIADTIVLAEERLKIQEAAIEIANKDVRNLLQSWQEDVKPDLQNLKEVHSNSLKRAMEEKKGTCREAVENNHEVKYLVQLIGQKEKEASLYSSSNSDAERILFNNNGGGDDDDQDDLELITSTNDINLVDPISKKTMTDPVRHTKCGHVYDRSSIVAMMRQKKHFKCPYIGCACKDTVREKNLEPAIDYLTEIRRRSSNRFSN